jgi:hypothetical protein
MLVGVKVEIPKRVEVSPAVHQPQKIKTIREGLNLGVSWRFDERSHRVIANSTPLPTTPAGVMGIQPGDDLIEVNGQPVEVTSLTQFEELMQRLAQAVSEGMERARFGPWGIFHHSLKSFQNCPNGSHADFPLLRRFPLNLLSPSSTNAEDAILICSSNAFSRG